MDTLDPQVRNTISSAGPSITDDEILLVTEAVRLGWYENMNMHIDQFISEFSAYTGWKYCLPTSNCTSAIHLALLGLNLSPNDEVIVPDITWVASAAPITYVGAKIVFCDIDPVSWCISPDSFEECITENTKAVISVGLAGNVPDMDKIQDIARHHNITIIEDAAECLGAEYKTKKAGTLGDISVFSFNATKLVIAGQGGMICTNDIDLYERFKRLAHHGIDKTEGAPYYWSTEIGYNYNWTNIQAALALAQFRRLDELVEMKRLAHNWYSERLRGIPSLTLNQEQIDTKSTFWLNVIIVSPEIGMKKETIQSELNNYGIQSRPFFYPISSMPAYSKYTGSINMHIKNPNAYRISPYGICPPSGFSLTEPDVEHICTALREILNI